MNLTIRSALKRAAIVVASAGGRRSTRWLKETAEFRSWRRLLSPLVDDPPTLLRGRAHYEHFFTEFFGLTREYYEGKAILDVGCGPMGSLEWATHARERVGLDPLADRYRNLLGHAHAMTYVAARSEAIPYSDGHFDVVASFNSLDHVEDVPRTVAEMRRVVSDHGQVLLIVEIGHPPTPTEPHHLDGTLLELFAPDFRVERQRRFGIRDDHDVYASIFEGLPYTDGGAGLLCARLDRVSGAQR